MIARPRVRFTAPPSGHDPRSYCGRCGREREPGQLREVTLPRSAVDGTITLRLCGACRAALGVK